MANVSYDEMRKHKKNLFDFDKSKPKKPESINSIGEAVALLQINMPNVKIESKLEFGYFMLNDYERYFLMYKREYYKNFKYHFPDVKKPDGKSYGWAQVMNKQVLDYILKKKQNVTWLLFATTDAKIYKCTPQNFYNFVTKYNTEVPHLKGEVAVPLDLFERLE
jgi:hypothetical protein